MTSEGMVAKKWQEVRGAQPRGRPKGASSSKCSSKKEPSSSSDVEGRQRRKRQKCSEQQASGADPREPRSTLFSAPPPAPRSSTESSQGGFAPSCELVSAYTEETTSGLLGNTSKLELEAVLNMWMAATVDDDAIPGEAIAIDEAFLELLPSTPAPRAPALLDMVFNLTKPLDECVQQMPSRDAEDFVLRCDLGAISALSQQQCILTSPQLSSLMAQMLNDRGHINIRGRSGVSRLSSRLGSLLVSAVRKTAGTSANGGLKPAQLSARFG